MTLDMAKFVLEIVCSITLIMVCTFNNIGRSMLRQHSHTMVKKLTTSVNTWHIRLVCSSFHMHITSFKTTCVVSWQSSQPFWHFGMKYMILCTNVYMLSKANREAMFLTKINLQLSMVIQMLEGYVHNLFHYGPTPNFGEWVQSPPLRSN